MSATANRLIWRLVGAMLVVMLIMITTRITYQSGLGRTTEQQDCFGMPPVVVFNHTEHDITVQGLARQQDGSAQDLEVVLAPNQSSEEAGICLADAMNVNHELSLFFMEFKVSQQPKVWVGIDQTVYCITGEEPNSKTWYDVMCSGDSAITE